MTIVDIPFNGCPNRDKRYKIAGTRIRPTKEELKCSLEVPASS